MYLSKGPVDGDQRPCHLVVEERLQIELGDRCFIVVLHEVVERPRCRVGCVVPTFEGENRDGIPQRRFPDPFDAAHHIIESSPVRARVSRLSSYRETPSGAQPRIRRLLATTDTLDRAMAADATIG